MEIYKLSGKIPEKRGYNTKSTEYAGGVRGGNSGLTITDMRTGVKNPNRVNVFVERQFAFALDVTQVVELKLKIGRVLTEEEFTECKRASEFGKVYQRALEWALIRPRSVRELKDYLRRREQKREAEKRKQEWQDERELKPRKCRIREEYDFDEIVIERLVSKGYVDDYRFAEWWVENRFVNKGVSRKRLMMELTKKGIAREIIEEVLDGRTDEEEARKMIVKKQGKYDEPEKLVAYLCRQGFSYDLAKKMVNETSDNYEVI